MANKTKPVPAEPGHLAASAVSGTRFGEVSVELTAARLDGLNESAARIGVALTRTALAHVQASETTVHRPRDWSWSGFRIMWMIWLFGEVEARDLARLAGASRQTTSSVLSTLETKGLVHRERTSTQDKRLVAVRLTPAGQAAFETAFVTQNQLDADAFGCLNETEQQQFVGYLERILHQITTPARTEPN